MEIERRENGSVLSLLPAEPLWKRVPTRDENGILLADFMMIIPRLHNKPDHLVKKTISAIEGILQCYQDSVVFADLNLKLNVLWISLRPREGICLELSAAIKLQVPEALLVSEKIRN